MVINLTYITEESVEVTKPSIRAVVKTKQLTRRKARTASLYQAIKQTSD